MNLGGKTVQELSVKPHFANIKEEVLDTGLLGARMFETQVVQKATEYLQSKRCRKSLAIRRGSPSSLQHLLAIIIYCDFTDLCTLFGRSLRKLSWDDDLESIMARNSMFFHISKRLRELVTYFGSDGGGGRDGKGYMAEVTRGPFFTGVNAELNMGEFSISFNITKFKIISFVLYIDLLGH